MNAEEIATSWMDQCCLTLKNHSHAAHMDLISKNVKVYGLKGIDVIEYDDWFEQCKQEFKDKLISHVIYSDLKIRKHTDLQIMFLTNQSVFSSDGAVYDQTVENVLALEVDKKWRVIQQRILSRKEAQEFKMI